MFYLIGWFIIVYLIILVISLSKNNSLSSAVKCGANKFIDMRKALILACFVALSISLNTISYTFSTRPTGPPGTKPALDTDGNYQAIFHIGGLSPTNKVKINVRNGVHGGDVSGLTASVFGDTVQGGVRTYKAPLTFGAITSGVNITSNNGAPNTGPYRLRLVGPLNTLRYFTVDVWKVVAGVDTYLGGFLDVDRNHVLKYFCLNSAQTVALTIGTATRLDIYHAIDFEKGAAAVGGTGLTVDSKVDLTKGCYYLDVTATATTGGQTITYQTD